VRTIVFLVILQQCGAPDKNMKMARLRIRGAPRMRIVASRAEISDMLLPAPPVG
jgi:hypothetical protein